MASSISCGYGNMIVFDVSRDHVAAGSSDMLVAKVSGDFSVGVGLGG